MSSRILVVDDDRSLCDLLEERLRRAGLGVTVVTSGERAFDLMSDSIFDVVVTDLKLRGMTGFDLCDRVVSNFPDLPVIIITAFGSFDAAVQAIRSGAYDFLVKPFEMEALVLAIERAARYRSLHEEVKRLRLEVSEPRDFQGLLGQSPPMLRIYEMVSAVAVSDASVLICGETGTGKELIARAIHRSSPRRSGPFMVLNCAALPEPLLESELFGHLRGAFTDARTDRTGLLVAANGGTLFLDEIGDMSPSVQPKLLRAIQERRVRPVGSDREIPYDVRLLSATHRDIEANVKEGSFRDDLLFRINVIRFDVPPLRARGNDVLLLAQHFVERFARETRRNVRGIGGPAAARLCDYSWPGNVRELENCMERAVALTKFEEITVEDLPERIRNYSREMVPLVGSRMEDLIPLEEIERRYILQVLEAVGGNKTLAAQILGLDRRTLYRKLDRFAPLSPPGAQNAPEGRA